MTARRPFEQPGRGQDERAGAHAADAPAARGGAPDPADQRVVRPARNDAVAARNDEGVDRPEPQAGVLRIQLQACGHTDRAAGQRQELDAILRLVAWVQPIGHIEDFRRPGHVDADDTVENDERHRAQIILRSATLTARNLGDDLRLTCSLRLHNLTAPT